MEKDLSPLNWLVENYRNFSIIINSLPVRIK